MRAAYDDGDAAVARLQDAARLAAEHGSAALLARCRGDLAARGVPVARSAFPRSPAVPAPRRTARERCRPSVGGEALERYRMHRPTRDHLP